MTVKMPINRESTARRQLNKFVAVLLSTFVICRLPWYAWHIVKAHGYAVDLTMCDIITDVTFCLAYSSRYVKETTYTFCHSKKFPVER